jgi:lichenan operon transcriptional antiterminator
MYGPEAENYMQGKHRNLLTTLVRQEKDWLRAADLSSRMNVSVRSVKNYVEEINQIHKDLIQSSRKGYHVDRMRAGQLLSNTGIHPSSGPKERLRFIIKRLLTGAHKYINLYRLCEDEIFVSVETAKKDLSAARKRFSEFDLHINMNGLNVTLEGSELDKRKMLSNILYEEFSENVFSLAAIEKVFPRHDVKFVYNTIIDTCKQHHFFINEYSLLTLLLDIVISIDRIKNDFTMPDEHIKQELNMPEYLAAKDIIRRMETHFNITYNDLEMNGTALVIVSNLIKTDIDAINMENIEQFVDKDCAVMIQSIKTHLSGYDFVDVSNDKFMSRLILHINNLLRRLKKRYTRKNPLTEHIKTYCPVIFECAVALSGIITQETGYKLSEHETAYIALHIGSLLSTHLSLRNKILCVLLFPAYYDYGEKLTARLGEFFGASLVIQNIITSVDELYGIKYPVDLVISAVKIPLSYKTPSVCISPFITEHDLTAIRTQIETIQSVKKKTRLFDQLRKISSPEIFCKNKTFKNQDEAIRYISGVMVKHGFVEESFCEEVLAREHSYSTAYGNIAIPHSMRMEAVKTGMFVLITGKPIPWGENQVNIVLLFSVNKETRNIFYDILDNLIVLLLETPNKAKIMECESYEEFINVLFECL